MAKTQWLLVFGTFAISCISLALLIVSISSNEWLKSEAYNELSYRNSEISYGLFSGTLTTYLLMSPQKFDLTVTCDYQEGICYYSCHETSENRHKELESLIKSGKLISCSPQTRILTNFKEKVENTYDEGANMNQLKQNGESNKEFIGSGYWVCTAMFLIISLFFSGLSAIFSLINVVLNPVEPIFSTFGLYIWNGITAGSILLTLIIWGSLFEISLYENIAIADTLTLDETYYSNGLATLGYSYFIVLIPLILSLLNIGLLLLRRYILSKEPPPTVISADEQLDTAISFY